MLLSLMQPLLAAADDQGLGYSGFSQIQKHLTLPMWEKMCIKTLKNQCKSIKKLAMFY